MKIETNWVYVHNIMDRRMVSIELDSATKAIDFLREVGRAVYEAKNGRD